MSAGSRRMVVLLNIREMEWDRMGGLYISLFTASQIEGGFLFRQFAKHS